MNLKVEAKLLCFYINQNNIMMHPLTCGGLGGECTDVSLNARQIKDTDQIEVYCTNCNEHSQFIVNYESDYYQFIYDTLLKVHRDGNIENILNK